MGKSDSAFNKEVPHAEYWAISPDPADLDSGVRYHADDILLCVSAEMRELRPGIGEKS